MEPDITDEIRRHIASGRLVVFVGNGVRRVPTIIIPDASPAHGSTADHGPSWQRYMEELWEFTKPQPHGPQQDDDLEFGAFSRLTAPRQAEWFDRRVNHFFDVTPAEAAMLRMHLLSCDLHPNEGVPHNSLLELVARITLDTLAAEGSRLDVITTNVDCAIEQNIARLVDQSLEAVGWAPVGSAPRLKVYTAAGTVADWQRANTASKGEIRIWKIHGCLGVLKQSPGSSWNAVQEKLVQRARAVPEKVKKPFGAAVPTDTLWPGSAWRNFTKVPPMRWPVVFSMSEYVNLLSRLLAKPPPDKVAEELQEIFSSRPLLFVGYDLHEVDIDVVAALHLLRMTPEPPRYALRFRRGPETDRHEEERLRQMGVRWWPFQLGPLALARLPGEMRLLERHEWRHGQKESSSLAEIRADLANPWRTKLQSISAREWSRAQETLLKGLVSDQTTDQKSAPATPEPRLVIAGLASISHAFALKSAGDFPSRRRVSAGLVAVDSQVPSGSGLVPAIVAAAIAGPEDAGWITFLTNVAREWPRWEEIEEFCLSAGIDVRPLQEPSRNAGARTSHVLLYDPHGKESTSPKPRQRMIMDVDDLVQPRSDHSSASVVAPRVKLVTDLNLNHLLFADKLAEHCLLTRWTGPIIFETGTSGTDLLDQNGAPTLWTASLGSLIRTLVCARFGCKKDGNWKADLKEGNVEQVLDYLARDEHLRQLVRDPLQSGSSYVVRINSYDTPLWDANEVSHDKEVGYGKWVMENWHQLGEALWEVIDHPTSGQSLVTPNDVLGRGFLVTLHEAGLMAHLERADRKRQSIIVRIKEVVKDATLQFVCEGREDSGSGDTLGPVTLYTPLGSDGVLTVPDCKPIQVTLATAPRRHTLGAGDTVRGCLAYGLWALMQRNNGTHRRRPRSLAHVLLASCVLASLKCYAGSFVEFLRVIEDVRNTDAWIRLWGFSS